MHRSGGTTGRADQRQRRLGRPAGRSSPGLGRQRLRRRRRAARARRPRHRRRRRRPRAEHGPARARQHPRHPRRRRPARRRARGGPAGGRALRPRRHLTGLASRPAAARAGRGRPASRSGARSSSPGGCAPRSGPAPVAHRHRHQRQDHDGATCSPRCCGRPGCGRRSAGNVGTPHPRGGPAPGALRRHRRRALQLPAALVALAGAARLGLPQRRARPRRLARLARGVRRAPRARSTRNTEIACVYNVQDPVTEQLVDGRRRAGGLPRGRLHPRHPRRCRWSAWSTTCSPTAPSSSSASTSAAELAHPGRPAGRRARPWRRTTSPTPWPRPRSLVPTACPPTAVRDGLRAFTPDPHRIADAGTVDGVRYVDDSKATNPHAAAASLARLRARRVGRRRPAQGRRRRRPRRAAPPRGCAAWCSSVPTARRSPRRSPDTRRMSPSSTSTSTDTGVMDLVVAHAADARPAGRRRAARARRGVHGHVRQLRRPRRRLRAGGRPSRCRRQGE